MKRIANILLGQIIIMSFALGGNESGAGGDPFLLEFYHRGAYVLEELKATPVVEKRLIVVFEQALAELKVEMSNSPLPS